MTISGSKFLYVLPAKYQLASVNFSFSSVQASDLISSGEIIPFSQSSKFSIIYKSFELTTVYPGTHFGESHRFVASMNENLVYPTEADDSAIRKFAIGNEADFVGRKKNPCSASIVAAGKVELIGISKLDFHKFSTGVTWKVHFQLSISP